MCLFMPFFVHPQVSPEGLIYRDYIEGEGELPVDGQEVGMHVLRPDM